MSITTGSQSTMSSRTSTEPSQQTTGTITPATSQDSQEHEAMFGATFSSQISELRSKFTYKPENAVTRPSSARASDAILRRRHTEAWASSSPQAIASTMKASLETATQPTLRAEQPPADQPLELEDSAWTTLEAEVVVAASSPPTTPKTRVRSPIRSKLEGSEDLLVPDSEAESECSPRKPMYNFSRFAFAG